MKLKKSSEYRIEQIKSSYLCGFTSIIRPISSNGGVLYYVQDMGSIPT